MLEVKPTGESGRTATGSGRNETFHNHVVVYYIISFSCDLFLLRFGLSLSLKLNRIFCRRKNKQKL